MEARFLEAEPQSPKEEETTSIEARVERYAVLHARHDCGPRHERPDRTDARRDLRAVPAVARAVAGRWWCFICG